MQRWNSAISIRVAFIRTGAELTRQTETKREKSKRNNRRGKKIMPTENEIFRVVYNLHQRGNPQTPDEWCAAAQAAAMAANSLQNCPFAVDLIAAVYTDWERNSTDSLRKGTSAHSFS